jgi:hypothetical protein
MSASRRARVTLEHFILLVHIEAQGRSLESARAEIRRVNHEVLALILGGVAMIIMSGATISLLTEGVQCI